MSTSRPNVMRGDWPDGLKPELAQAGTVPACSRSTLVGVSLTVHLPEDLSRRVTEVAHVSPEQVAIETIESHLPASDPLEAFIGSGDSGDPSWAGRDTHELRAEAAEHHAAS